MAKRSPQWLFFWRRQSESAAEKPPTQQLIDFLAGQISAPGRAGSVLDRVSHFRQLPPAEQLETLPGVYLLLEQFLSEVDPLKKYTRQQLRELTKGQYPSLLASEQFRLIFEPERPQEILLCRFLLEAILQRSYAMMGASLDGVRGWLALVPHDVTLPLPLELDGRIPEHHREWLALMRHLSLNYYQLLQRTLGEQVAGRFFENGYNDVAQLYQGLETFPVVIGILPEEVLDEQKISLLSHRQIQRALLENVDQLEEINRELAAKNYELERTQAQLIAAREDALRSSIQFRSVLNTMAEGIVTFDENGRIVLVNREVQNAWGYTAKELVGQPLATLVAPTTAAWLTPDHHDTGVLVNVITPLLGTAVELEGQRKNGHCFPIEMHITETIISGQTWYTAAVSDITERKQAEAAMTHARDLAIQTSELKTRILASVSHDLRTPLNTVIGYADMLAEGVFDELNEKQQAIVARILSSGKHMAVLITDLLDQTRLEGGQLVIDNAPFSPTALLQDTLALLSLSARTKGIELTGSIAPNLPGSLVGDTQRLQQVITNLAANAVKFTEAGQVQVLFASPDEHLWTMEVKDTGRGIPKTAYKTIFEPFQQLKEPAANDAQANEKKDGHSKKEGFGLGLYIVKELVTLMNGRITVYSEVGKGSTFTVWLPLVVPQEELAHDISIGD
jgi:protein-histidine pros-kinase